MKDQSEKAYEYGFGQVCARCGVEPEQLIKQAQWAQAARMAGRGLAKAAPHLAMPAAGAAIGGITAKMQDHDMGQGALGGLALGSLGSLLRAGTRPGLAALKELRAARPMVGGAAAPAGYADDVIKALTENAGVTENALGGTATGLGAITAGGMAEENHPWLNRIRLMLGL